MINVGTEYHASTSADGAFSFISKGWREVRDYADADLRLMRARATSFKSIADRELENFINSASVFAVPVQPLTAAPSPALSMSELSSSSIAEVEFVKRVRPKLSELRRVYSSPELSKKVRERWGPSSTIRLDLSAIKSAFATEMDATSKIWELNWDTSWQRGWRRARWMLAGEEVVGKEWNPVRMLKTGIKEFGRKSQSSDILGNFKNSEFVEKMKLNLKSFRGETQDLKDVPPLDVSELLAYLVKQSGSLVEQLGFKRDICDKIVDALCSKRKDRHMSRSLSVGDLDHGNIDADLDYRINAVLQSTGHHYDGGFWDNKKHDPVGHRRHVAVVTTASLPWMTGTAVNPLLRAAYLAKFKKQNVTLLVPWLCKSDQELVYPNGLTFRSPEDQEIYIRNWVEERIGFSTDFKISFYPGKFSKERRSIVPAGDTSQFISSKEADIAILEEPEHLNWYHHGKRWTDKFNHVIGVVHTNYLEYIKREKNGALQAFLVKHINNWVVRAYCTKVLRLSAATQDLPKSVICNVHGVNPKFLNVAEKIASERELGRKAFSKGAYFLGKMVWAKGYRELIDLLARHKNDLDGFNLDVYGNGEDAHEVQSAAKKLDLNINFLKGRDHTDDSLHRYKVFINPSVSDVLCTATAEALAMGKFVICADHPSNDFFRTFPNCLTYKTSEDFVARVKEAMVSEPQPFTAEQSYNLSWEAATQRFMEYSELDKVMGEAVRANNTPKFPKSVSMPSLWEVVDGGLAAAHYCLTGNELLRLSTGAVPGTRDYDKQHSKDLSLLPPQVQKPIYGW